MLPLTQRLLIVALSGAAGCVLRYLLITWSARLGAAPFPAGTVLVNMLGCLAIGFVAPLLLEAAEPLERMRLAIVVGFLGGFTTFSAFAWETLHLANARRFDLALLNVGLSNGLGLLCAWMGHQVGRLVFRG